MSWLTVKDVKVRQVVKGGPYNGAVVVKVFRNGWCRLKWKSGQSAGEQFSVRVHWLTDKKDIPWESRRLSGHWADHY